jgi:putative ABC transport system ATP-binding protein
LSRAAGPVSLEVRDLGYGFQGATPLFDGLSFEVKPGERVALVGASGSGRGTLLDLLLGTRAPLGGFVRVDGVEIREVELDALRERAALVRGVEVVAGTVAENVRAGRALPDDEVRRALAAVGLLDVVACLPGGIHTPLGPLGRPLSGSQARRLVLARALAGRPGLLLVDELVDGVPPNARGAVLDALFAPDRPATVLLVTRDPDVIRRCDRVLVFDRPRLGRPAEVRAEGGASWVA